MTPMRLNCLSLSLLTLLPYDIIGAKRVLEDYTQIDLLTNLLFGRHYCFHSMLNDD